MYALIKGYWSLWDSCFKNSLLIKPLLKWLRSTDDGVAEGQKVAVVGGLDTQGQ